MCFWADFNQKLIKCCVGNQTRVGEDGKGKTENCRKDTTERKFGI